MFLFWYGGLLIMLLFCAKGIIALIVSSDIFGLWGRVEVLALSRVLGITWGRWEFD